MLFWLTVLRKKGAGFKKKRFPYHKSFNLPSSALPPFFTKSQYILENYTVDPHQFASEVPFEKSGFYLHSSSLSESNLGGGPGCPLRSGGANVTWSGITVGPELEPGVRGPGSGSYRYLFCLGRDITEVAIVA
ncbi:uncharacterized protein A4U43_C07F15540 [Asparagus officinalis]|uniref:Uncharacterized protein n=1 Tax=Asparagus officinalis TaxID=4686 RepID=A0A5P1EC66_ASPOF|nr:uncharacterized protein A4U43_C07F15540 [Asparagus officinalis]